MTTKVVPTEVVPTKLVSVEGSRKIDEEAQSLWGFNTFALIEAAGRNCARILEEAVPEFLSKAKVYVYAGSGNNGADALVMLRVWLLKGLVNPYSTKVFLSHLPENNQSPINLLILSLKKMQVSILNWDGSFKENDADIILDGIAGTGLRGPIKDKLKEMVEELNSLKKKTDKKPLIVSIDLPSGLFEEWKQGMPLVKADITLAIEPQKFCLYNPASRSHSGTIIPVGGIFPVELITSMNGPLLIDWEYCRTLIPKIHKDIHKYQRGTVEIQAGSKGYTGAPFIAAQGAQAAGAGLVHLIVDSEIYPIIASAAASRAAGIMVSSEEDSNNLKPDALLLGPGWGRELDRNVQMENALNFEKSGIPIILDAQGISLSRDLVFHGNALITPHTGEFAAYIGLSIDDILSQPGPILLKIAAERNVFILLKSHSMFIAAPDGRWAIIDGMAPNLASGGSGDLLAGFCAALAARMYKNGSLDLFNCAAAAAALLIQVSKAKGLAERFTDPLELADSAADFAGKAWLGEGL